MAGSARTGEKEKQRSDIRTGTANEGERREMVMINKKKLKETETFIDHDRTWRERRAWDEIRTIAGKEKRGGKDA